MGDVFYTLLVLLPLFFWLAVFIFIIYLIVRWLKNKIRNSVEPLYQQQELLTKELKEVKARLQALELNLKDEE